MVEISNKNNNKVVRVSVGGSTGNNPTITPNGDYSSYYSELSKAWAIKMDGMVSREDYSSKYYATQAKANAETTENNLNSVISEHEQITNEITEARENISGDLAGALTDIATARDESVAKVTETKTNSLSEIESAKTEAEQTITTGLNNFNANAKTKSDSLQSQFDSAMTDIQNQQTKSVNAVKTAQSTAETSITNLQTTAESTITSGIADIKTNKEQSMAAIDKNRTDSLSEISTAGTEQISNIKKTGFYMQDDKLYYINADGETKEFVSGGGRELLEIYIDPFCDESENKGRIANGQIIFQSQFKDVTKKLKKRVGWDSENKKATLNTSLVCSEEDWQAIKTASKLGQCGKFVIDDEAGTIRLPLIININGLTDLSNAGLIKSESLPNISGHFILADNVATNSSGSTTVGSNKLQYADGAFSTYTTGTHNTVELNANTLTISQKEQTDGITFNANNSSSTYTYNAPVQQEAVQYPYVICVNTGVEETERPINQYEINNPYSLFDCKFADHKLSNLSWLLSTGDYYSGTTYTAAYNELLSEYNNSSSVSETANGVTYKRTPKGYKIALSDQKDTIDSLYTSTGVAWFYILDQTNTKFILPRTKYGFSGVRNKVGDYITESLPNITGSLSGETAGGFAIWNRAGTGALYNNFSSETINGYQTVTSTITRSSDKNVRLDASKSSSTYKDGAPVQERSTEMYLYFFVGETAQNTNLIDTARIQEQLIEKADINLSNLSTTGKTLSAHLAMPSTKYIDLTLNATGSSYTAPADGWVEAACNSTSNEQAFIEVNTEQGSSTGTRPIGGWGRATIPISKGTTFQVYYGGTSFEIKIFRFIYAVGSEPTA